MSDPYLNCPYCLDQCACRATRDELEALKEKLESVNEAWVSVLHDNGLIDMKDADGANKKFVLDRVQERLAQKRY